MAIKSILFNTEMVRAILDGRKSKTRRIVKQPPIYGDILHDAKGWHYEDGTRSGHTLTPPYAPGDIMYVPEAWKCRGTFGWSGYEVEFRDGQHAKFQFEDRDRAEKWDKYRDKPSHQWQSPYFMPREAARIFLRVTGVRVERLQEISREDTVAEGVPCGLRLHGGYCGNGGLCDCDDYKKEFASLWNSTIKKADIPRYGWDANPWCWVISFERITKDEAMQ